MKRGFAATERELEPLVGVFRLLSDRTRIQILIMLADGERNVGAICEELKLPQPTVSHHLGLLRMQNLISSRRNGKQVFYALNGHVNASSADGLQIEVDQFHVRVSTRNP